VTKLWVSGTIKRQKGHFVHVERGDMAMVSGTQKRQIPYKVDSINRSTKVYLSRGELVILCYDWLYEGDEFFPNGIFNFNISRILEDINAGLLQVEYEEILVQEWCRTHGHGSINEEHLPTVDVTKSILQAEIRPGMFKIIDGNHRIEKAFRDGILSIHSYKLRGEHLIPYFMRVEGYKAFVDYWNSKL
jgi:hypothetical protein